MNTTKKAYGVSNKIQKCTSDVIRICSSPSVSSILYVGLILKQPFSLGGNMDTSNPRLELLIVGKFAL